MDESMAAEGFTRLTYEIAEGKGAILGANDPEIVRRHLELHRERLQEELDDQLRRLDVLETLLTARSSVGSGRSGDDPHLLEGGGDMPRRGETHWQGRDVADPEIEDGTALDLDPDGPLQHHEHFAR